jgi:hypothetical protein
MGKNHILNPDHQKRQKIQNIKIGLFLLISDFERLERGNISTSSFCDFILLLKSEK